MKRIYIMQEQYSISIAKNNLPKIIHSVEDGSAVQLTRHGKPVAVLVSFVQYQGLVKQKKDFWTALTYFKKSSRKEEPLIEDRDFNGLRDENQGRDVDMNTLLQEPCIKKQETK
jgi:prevent-host-death family protein